VKGDRFDLDIDHSAKIFRAGCEILDRIMKPHGFQFVPGESGMSKFGPYARGDYVRKDRRLELHFRYSLGLVTYHIGDVRVSHDVYLRALTKGAGGNQYPGFSDDPLDGFRHLANDLQKFCGDFLSGGGEVLLVAARDQRAREDIESTIYAARAVGDERERRKARELFREKKYREVLELLGNLKYPELMNGSEKKMLEIAQRNIDRNDTSDARSTN
jgi:hypothetical protein